MLGQIINLLFWTLVLAGVALIASGIICNEKNMVTVGLALDFLGLALITAAMLSGLPTH